MREEGTKKLLFLIKKCGQKQHFCTLPIILIYLAYYSLKCYSLNCYLQNQLPRMNTTYQTPPTEILDLINVPYSPLARLSPNRQWMLLLGRPSMPPVAEVAQEELRLAGLRINPQTNGSSRSLYYNNII